MPFFPLFFPTIFLFNAFYVLEANCSVWFTVNIYCYICLIKLWVVSTQRYGYVQHCEGLV